MKATIVLISHDDLEQIEKDRYFGEKLVEAIKTGSGAIEATDDDYRKLNVGVGVNMGDVEVPFNIYKDEDGIMRVIVSLAESINRKVDFISN
jgi:hypothetical protein